MSDLIITKGIYKKMATGEEGEDKENVYKAKQAHVELALKM